MFHTLSSEVKSFKSWLQSEFQEFDKFKAMTGRSDTNPYGDAGMFGSRADYSRTMSPRQIDQINRMAFEQARGLTSGEGYQGSGMDSPQPGYAPALKIGENIPGGTVQRATPRGTGLGSFFKDGGFLGAFLSDIGGRAPRRFAANAPAAPFLPDGDALGAVDYDIRAARPAPRPYNAAEMLQNNMPIANPIRERGVFDVSPMEEIANPGGQVPEVAAGPQVDMFGDAMMVNQTTENRMNVSDLLDLRDRAQRTTAAVDNAIANVGQALDRDYSPSPADVTRENVMDAILADQIRDRNARNARNLVLAAAGDPQPVYTPELENQFTEQMLDMMPTMQDIRYSIINPIEFKELEEAERQAEARRMSEINNPPGDPLDLFMEDDVGQMLSDLEMSLRRGSSQPR